jgi:uncharacterized membrane protein YuzA (DUF378 family)
MKSPLNMVSGIILAIGGLNWGLVGLGYFLKTNLNLVNLLLGSIPVAEAIVYLLVGIAAVIHAYTCMKSCTCENK